MYFKYIKAVYLFIIVAVLAHYALFRTSTIGIEFVAPNILIVIVALIYYQHHLTNSVFNVTTSQFEKKIFLHALLLRVIVAAFLSVVFYMITGTLHDVEAIDSKVYHEIASFMADRFRHSGVYDTSKLFDSFDDNGYVHVMGLVYLVTNNSILLFRLFQCVIGSATVVLLYRISKMIFENEKAARITAVLAVAFPHIVEYPGILLKETILAFSFLLCIYSFLEIFRNGFKLKFVVLVVAGLIVCSSMRFVYALILLPAFVFHVLNNMQGKRFGVVRIFFSICIVIVLFVFVVGKMGFREQLMKKSSAYVAYVGDGGNVGDEHSRKRVSVGGKDVKQNEIFRYSVRFGGAAMFIPFSMSFPFPTFLKTNIVFFNQTLKWYFVGGVLLWNFLSFFSIVGLVASVKKKFRESSILLFVTTLLVAVLLKGFVITSDRHNLIKEIILLVFAGVGLDIKLKHKYQYFLAYSALMLIAVVGFSFFKLKARGAM